MGAGGGVCPGGLSCSCRGPRPPQQRLSTISRGPLGVPPRGTPSRSQGTHEGACWCVCTCMRTHVYKHAHRRAAVPMSGSMCIHCRQGRVCLCVQPAAATRGRAGLAVGRQWGLAHPGWVRDAGAAARGSACRGPTASVSQPHPRAPGEAQAPPRGVWFRKWTFLTRLWSPFSSPEPPAGMVVAAGPVCVPRRAGVPRRLWTRTPRPCPSHQHTGVGPAWSVWKSPAQGLASRPHRAQKQEWGAG